MTTSQIYIPAQTSGSNYRFFSCLRSLGRRLSRYAPLRILRPLIRRVLYTAEPAGRLSINATPAAQGKKPCGTLTVISANLWHDWPKYRRMSARLDDFAHLVEEEGADIILLQEVARTPSFHVDEWLEQRLGMAYVYSRANGHHGAIGFEEGLAVFSRFPLREPHLKQLDTGSNPFVRRLVLGASVETPCGDLLAFSAHLGLSPQQNAKQVERLRSWVADVAGQHTALIGGDFNAHEDKPQIQQARRSWVDTFRHLNSQTDGTTHELRWPWGKPMSRKRLDYIFLHPGKQQWQVLETRHLHAPHAPHSDHRAVMTRLTPALQPA